jgi:CubicO group peptidase (beta-lactamase class C family)
MLVQDGSLDLSDTVFGPGDILQLMSNSPKPCFPVVDNRINSGTVEHLLTHTGGRDRDVAFDPMFRSKIVSSTLGIPGPADCDDIIYYMFGKSLQYDPGTTYAYSNFQRRIMYPWP